MIKTSDKYKQKIIENGRLFKTKIHFNNETVTLIDEIRTVVINEVSQNETTLKMGQVGINKVTITFDMPDDAIPLLNGNLRIENGLFIDDDYEYINLGTYYITDITKSDNSNVVTIVAYDSASRLNATYTPTIIFPTDLENVVADILKQCNINMQDFNFLTTTINGYIEGTTCKQMIGYMAGLMGKNVRINKDNKLEFYWYSQSDIEITYDLQFMNGFNRTTEKHLKLTSITSGSEENVLVSGTGYGISFENPYMTQEILDEIYTNSFLEKGIIYQPSTIKWRGNPSIECRDMVKAQNSKGEFETVILTENTINLTGFNCEINCKGETETEVAMSQSPMDIKINKVYKNLTNAFKESTETILGHNGGYFTIDMSKDGFPSGWTIMNTPTLREDTKLWKMTAGGFGFSNDGGKTFSNITIDMLGRISANSITTGFLSGENFELDLEEGVLKLGERDKQGVMANEWLRADKNGLYIKAMQEVGSNNLFKDSMGMFNNMFDKNVWSGVFDIDSTIEVKNRNVYGYGILLKKDTLKQSQHVPNGIYTISFLYKKHIDLAVILVKINGNEYSLSNNEYTSFTETVIIGNNQIDIEFIADTDKSCSIVNLMANQGESASVWSLAQGETWDEYVKIGHGIQIGNASTKVTFVAMADTIGFKSNTTGEFVSIFTDTGLVTNEVVVKKKATIVNLLIQEINNQTVINRIGGSE